MNWIDKFGYLIIPPAKRPCHNCGKVGRWKDGWCDKEECREEAYDYQVIG